MNGLRILQNGKWNKPPTLFAARRIFFEALGRHFPLRKLDDVATFLNGTSYSVSEVNDCAKYPIIRISNISDPSGRYLLTNEELGRRFWIDAGDLLVSWSASFKTIIWPGPSGFLNQHIFKVTEREGFDKSFVRHAIEASFDLMQENVVGIGMMHLRRADFLLHEIPAPPMHVQKAVATYLDNLESGGDEEVPELPDNLSEQRRIVARIEALAAEIDEAKRLRREAVEEAEALFMSELRLIFDRSIESHGRTSLDRLIVEAGYGSSAKCDTERTAGTTPVLRIPNVALEQISLTDLKFGYLDERDLERLAVSPGDVLVVRTNGSADLVGRCAVAPKFEEPIAFASYMIRLRFDPTRIVPDYAQRMLRHLRVSGALIDFARTTAGQYNVSLGRLRAGEIPVPPLPEQRRIVAELDALQAQVDALKRLQFETAAELDALLPAILDRAFKGEL